MNENSWSKWSSISETLSSVAIVVTLVFLVVQTGQNTDAINAQIQASRAESRAAIWELAFKSIDQSIANPSISINLESTEVLSAEDEAQLFDYLIGFWATREFVWLQYRDGVVDEKTYKAMMDERLMFDFPKVASWWDEFALEYFDSEFVELINTQYRN